MTPRLTVKLLAAIEEALAARLAGEMDEFCPPTEDYDRAHEWACAQLEKRWDKMERRQ